MPPQFPPLPFAATSSRESEVLPLCFPATPLPACNSDSPPLRFTPLRSPIPVPLMSSGHVFLLPLPPHFHAPTRRQTPLWVLSASLWTGHRIFAHLLFISSSFQFGLKQQKMDGHSSVLEYIKLITLRYAPGNPSQQGFTFFLWFWDVRSFI